ALRLGVQEFLALEALSGLDPFAPLDMAPAGPFGAVRPPILRFIELVEHVKASPFKVSQLEYFLQHVDLTGKASPQAEDVLAYAQTLRADLLQIEREHTAQSDPTGEIAMKELSLVYGAEATGQFFGLLGETTSFGVAYTQAEPELSAAVRAVTTRISYDRFQKQLLFSGVMPDGVRDDLKAAAGVSNAFKDAVEALYTASRSFFDRYPELLAPFAAFAASNASTAEKMTALLAQFIPALQAKLKRQHVAQSLSAQLGADLELANALLANADRLHAAAQADQPAVQDILALETEGLSADIYYADDVAGAPDQTGLLAAGVNYGARGEALPANPGGGAISGVWDGYLVAPDNGFYVIGVSADAGAQVELSIDGEPVPLVLQGGVWQNQAPIELTAGRLTAFRLTAKKVTATLSLSWEREGMGRALIPAAQFYPATLVNAFTATYLRLLKAFTLSGALQLSVSEFTHFTDHADYRIGGEGWLNALPVAESHDAARTQALLGAAVALVQYRQWKGDLKLTDDRLIPVLADPAAMSADGRALLGLVTGWAAGDVAALLSRFGLAQGDLVHLADFGRVGEAMKIVASLGIGAASLGDVTTNAPSAALTRTLQEALRARHDPDEWLKVIQAINDALRSLRRDALVAYILHQLSLDAGTAHIDTPDKLYEWFLIDVEMDPCMLTSRLVLALSSVQLFIQRCLLNLEPQVAASSINADEWAWMKRYRVWEANRKVFLWPENWLEPELRDNKSPFFKDLEGELLQSDITEDAAATALVHYLQKLDEVAKLEICGLYVETNATAAAAGEKVHVVGRTSGQRRTYYYRRLEAGSWTAWEKIGVQIEENPVLPVVWRGRLFVFWVSVLQAGGTPTS
ncbi:MAG TPA: neuraminidase-like domain-containing protein, partial [Limnochordia bacterium]|nr:neuraminidase-like domain-containing protein [Limnochordia bacterium]